MVNKLEAGERWQHVKRGTSYEVLGTALLQDAAGNGVQEGHPLVIYRGDDGLVWARGAGEFVDGRFVKVAATPANGEQVERRVLIKKLREVAGLEDRNMKFNGNAIRRFATEAADYLGTLSTPTEDARSRVKVLEEALPFSEWHEDLGDVLWWKLPLAGAPYCGSPLDLGRGMKVTVQIGFEEHEMPIAHTGGWPFTEEDKPDLWWTPLPSPTFFRTALGNKETDRHG